MINKEGLAFMFVVEHFGPSIHGSHFVVRIDCIPLKALKTSCDPNSHLVQWAFIPIELYFWDAIQTYHKCWCINLHKIHKSRTVLQIWYPLVIMHSLWLMGIYLLLFHKLLKKIGRNIAPFVQRLWRKCATTLWWNHNATLLSNRITSWQPSNVL